MYGVSYFGFAVTFLYACLILVLMKRIALAVAVVKEAARAIGKMPLIIFVPVFESIAIVCFLIPWVIYVVFLASSGTISTTTETVNGFEVTYKNFSYDKNTQYAFLYFLFCWFWTSEFIIAVGQIVVAMAVTAWYFTHDKSTVGNTTTVWVNKLLK